MATRLADKTGMIPFVLFGIFAVIVGYCIWKGTHPNGINKDAE